jgi:hypothetical protein
MKRSRKSYYCVILVICYFNDPSRLLHLCAALQNMCRLIQKLIWRFSSGTYALFIKTSFSRLQQWHDTNTMYSLFFFFLFEANIWRVYSVPRMWLQTALGSLLRALGVHKYSLGLTVTRNNRIMLDSDRSSNRFVLFCRLVPFGSWQNASSRNYLVWHLFSCAEIYRECNLMALYDFFLYKTWRSLASVIWRHAVW